VGGKIGPVQANVKETSANQGREKDKQAGIYPYPNLPLWSIVRDTPQPYHRAKTNPNRKCVHSNLTCQNSFKVY
jgi:hypothetical protein